MGLIELSFIPVFRCGGICMSGSFVVCLSCMCIDKNVLQYSELNEITHALVSLGTNQSFQFLARTENLLCFALKHKQPTDKHHARL